MQCDKCHRDLVDGEPVYRPKRGWPSGLSTQCGDCRSSDLYDWRPSAPCGCCGRPVVYASRHPRRYAMCGDRACQLAIRNADLRAQRQPPRRVCAGCGAAFQPKRADAVFCSSPCRQRAYRQRLAAP